MVIVWRRRADTIVVAATAATPSVWRSLFFISNVNFVNQRRILKQWPVGGGSQLARTYAPDGVTVRLPVGIMHENLIGWRITLCNMRPPDASSRDARISLFNIRILSVSV